MCFTHFLFQIEAEHLKNYFQRNDFDNSEAAALNSKPHFLIFFVKTYVHLLAHCMPAREDVSTH